MGRSPARLTAAGFFDAIPLRLSQLLASTVFSRGLNPFPQGSPMMSTGDIGDRVLLMHEKLSSAIATHVLAGAGSMNCPACAASQNAFACVEEATDEIYDIGTRLRQQDRATHPDRQEDSVQNRVLLQDCKALKLQVQEITDSKIELLQHVEALSTAERALATELSNLRIKQEDSARLIQEQHVIIQSHAAEHKSHAAASRRGSVCGEDLELIDETCEEEEPRQLGHEEGGRIEKEEAEDDKDQQIARLSQQLADAEERLRVLSKEVAEERKAQKKLRVC